MDLSLLVVVVIVTALAFDFTNGFHDTANAMATSIATGALSPRVAVGVSAVFNLAGAFLSVQVAKTISSGIVDETKINSAIIFGGLVGAIVWNLLTWLLGLPSSSSHALFGGLIGATWIAAGSDAVHFGTVVEKVIVPALASPIIAGVVATLATWAAYKITERADKTGRAKGFKAGQILSASMVSLAHGTNDAQKTMGVITLTLIAAGTLPAGANPPLLVILGSGLAISLGTFLGGWRIIRTLGKGLTEIETPQGFAAEASATATILASTQVGFALSTTHVATGAIVGSGVGKRLSEVRWGVAGRMALAWLFTLPAAAIVGAVAGETASLGNVGTVIVALAAVVVAVGAYLLSRRQPVSAGNVNEMPSTTAPATASA
ncbi:anion permease [Kutzneria sp. NPDC052558]|uniref:anion permease n=1 Tax=Kutzneria sp. NPDC052558 TaxID=3364121 RepID=UPI0037C9DF28